MDEVNLEEALGESLEEKPKKRRKKSLDCIDKISFGITEASFKKELKDNMQKMGIKSYTDAHKDIQGLRSALMKTLTLFGLDVNKLLIALKEAEQK